MCSTSSMYSTGSRDQSQVARRIEVTVQYLAMFHIVVVQKVRGGEFIGSENSGCG